MPNNFARAHGLGKWGEKQVIKHLESHGLEVRDVSEDKRFQNKGIDILVKGQGRVFAADIKLDRMIARTGNLFIETMSSDKIMGNIFTSKADFFLYLDPFDCHLYTINRKKMLKFWIDNQKDIIIKTVGGSKRQTQGFLITVEDIVQFGLATVEPIYVEGSRKNKFANTYKV